MEFQKMVKVIKWLNVVIAILSVMFITFALLYDNIIMRREVTAITYFIWGNIGNVFLLNIINIIITIIFLKKVKYPKSTLLLSLISIIIIILIGNSFDPH
ncbi:MAG: hypothetical protein CVV22_11010 [Ignavibacteriae bacterium HGW-Ignavibacteriae-1]|jgi:hypothetical protein|nr:MAG: hypothetical protein CVV22_11010 [Ignavibacteriae bacterium HGW-Ignavibacteriae-1]